VTFLDKLERHFARFAIPGLMRYVVALNALVFILVMLDGNYAAYLTLDPILIKQGQVWRLLTWIFLPTTLSPLWIAFYLMFTWWVGDSLEATWGTFRLNLYYFLGMIGCTISAFVVGVSPGNLLLSASLLLAAATLAPNLEILFLIFPLKLKWAALISLIYPWGILLVIGPVQVKMMIVICLLNYIVFFGPQLIRNALSRQKASVRRAKFEAAKDTSPNLHRCEVCGVTEISNPDAEFRVAEDGHEYCTQHLPR